MDYILLFFSIKYNGDWDKIYNALERKEKVALKDIRELEKKYINKKWMTILDNKYPRQFKEAYKPPFVFFYEGDLNLLKKDKVFISIDKIIDAKENELISNSIKILSKNNVIINSENTEFEKKLLDKTYKIVNQNIIVTHKAVENECFKNIKNSLIISEHPISGSIEKKNTNRLIASLSNSLILFNSSEKKHSHIVSSFLNLGKEIYCFPKEKENFNNELIKQGANIITSIKELDKDLDIERQN